MITSIRSDGAKFAERLHTRITNGHKITHLGNRALLVEGLGVVKIRQCRCGLKLVAKWQGSEVFIPLLWRIRLMRAVQAWINHYAARAA